MIALARDAHPAEACGILLGAAGDISQAVSARNVHPEPATRFEIDPQALIDAYRAEREGGPKVMGYFHSHPTGDPYPSQADRSMSAKDGKIWAIIAGDKIMFWSDTPIGFEALSYTSIDP